MLLSMATERGILKTKRREHPVGRKNSRATDSEKRSGKTTPISPLSYVFSRTHCLINFQID